MKKILLATMIILGLTGIASASPVEKLGIDNCGDSYATIRFNVTSSGWYYVISSSDSQLNGWHFAVPFIRTVLPNANTNGSSSVVVVDNATGTIVTGYCES
ncbi:MAG: hypothetical protein Q9M94_05820 [Candidatus Gracilibacteria bacterium]|nr:hypothetical protein [Candidatus Gracilibacteria bacterium]MDQ7022505.1 hypothetical protein [Candidatus Gracilibacteria bacterium]